MRLTTFLAIFVTALVFLVLPFIFLTIIRSNGDNTNINKCDIRHLPPGERLVSVTEHGWVLTTQNNSDPKTYHLILLGRNVCDTIIEQ